MSEIEKIQRSEYQKKRKMVIRIFSAVVLFLLLVTAFTSFTYNKLNKQTYVSYTQSGQVTYYAYLADNEFYDVDHLNGSHAYVASLIDRMTADFCYDLSMGTENVQFQYSYRIDAQLEIQDKATNAAIFDPVYEILPTKTMAANGRTLSIRENVAIDYNFYNTLARSFLETYQLNGTSASLAVRLYVDVVGISEHFAADNTDQYVVELHIPVVQDTVKPSVSTTVPAGPQQILAKAETGKEPYKIIAFICGGLALCVALAQFIYCNQTADKHIDYSRRVRQVVSNYQSYIQKINNPFDSSTYQVLQVDSIKEMLSLRDTLQKPVLMYENEDRTCTQFFITADTQIMYLYEIKVEDDI